MVNAEVVILAPRGEFSGAALKLKSFKKKGFILFSKLLGLHKNVSWHASSKYEMEDIIQNIPVLPNKIFIAPNLSLPIKKNDINQKEVGKENTLRIVFLSRISPMKNLDFSLHVLKLVKGVIIFDIYGPAEDDEYWQKCCEIIGRLPDNISVNYHGAVKPEEVIEVFSTYDLFFFPTRGENYGHVIFEALSVGTPVMISDQTPWKNLKEKSLGWELPINTGYEPFVTLIESYVGMGIKERKSWREEIQNKMRNNGSDKKNIDANRQLFLHLL
jgi:glycosyltransferase involved in cell wall biosynthesis